MGISGEKNLEKYRHELKFLCEEQELCLMENKIRQICKVDEKVGERGNYLIKSLYFDTYDDRCYYENQAGVDNRKKYRIRIYNNDTDVIKLECKCTYRDRKRKEVCEINKQQCEYIMQNVPDGISLQEGARQNLLYHFLIEKRIDLLKPKVIVEYTRTPYIFQAGNVRITFDRAIRSSFQVAHFLEKNIMFRSILPENVHILEVKYDEFLPTAILELLAIGHELSRVSFSKYSLCREHGIG